MGFLHNFEHILTRLPEIERPKYALPFNDRMKWTALMLITYFIMLEVPLFGLSGETVDYFANMRAIIAGSFGSIMTLGIGPIVTASIILQIMVGGKLIDIDLQNPRDQAIYQGTQKVLAILFTIFEAAIMVGMGALPAANGLVSQQLMIVAQLTLGGILIIYMDEVVSKWGFGSGIGLFIVAGVCAEIIIGAFNPFGDPLPTGALTGLFGAIISGAPLWETATRSTGGNNLIMVFGTILVFMAVVYVESVRVEIPISYGKFRGARGRYPIKFIYASNIPVIFASIFMANVQLWARMLESAGLPLLGHFAGTNRPVDGLAYYMTRPSPVGTPQFDIMSAAIYTLLLVILSMIFSKFWVETAGQDVKSVARQLHQGGMQIPGFRGDIRIVEKVLGRYIPAVTLLGGASVGVLAAFGDLTGCLGGGTGVLLTVGILYRLYEQMAKEQMFEMHPMLRKVIGE